MIEWGGGSLYHNSSGCDGVKQIENKGLGSVMILKRVKAYKYMNMRYWETVHMIDQR